VLKGPCHGNLKFFFFFHKFMLQSSYLFTNYTSGRVLCKIGYRTEREKKVDEGTISKMVASPFSRWNVIQSGRVENASGWFQFTTLEILESFRSEKENETTSKTSFVRERSCTLFSFFCSCSSHLLLWIENNRFRVLCSVFYVFSREKLASSLQ